MKDFSNIIGGITESIPPKMIDVTRRGLFICMSVALMHPAKAIGQNEVPFGRDACMVPSNSILDRGLVSIGRGDLAVRIPSSQQMPPIAKLFWPLFYFVSQYFYFTSNKDLTILRSSKNQQINNKINKSVEGQSNLAIGGIAINWVLRPLNLPFDRHNLYFSERPVTTRSLHSLPKKHILLLAVVKTLYTYTYIW